MGYSLIDWNGQVDRFYVRGRMNETHYCETAEDAITKGLRMERTVRANEKMEPQKLVEVMAAAIFKRVPLFDLAGKELTGTPVPEANVSYITRDQMGAIIPEGWFIECQLNRYSACWGEQMTFPARTNLASAIADIHQFLLMGIAQQADDLLKSVQAGRALAEAEQLPMWLSSDSPKGAAVTPAQLDSMPKTTYPGFVRASARTTLPAAGVVAPPLTL